MSDQQLRDFAADYWAAQTEDAVIAGTEQLVFGQRPASLLELQSLAVLSVLELKSHPAMWMYDTNRLIGYHGALIPLSWDSLLSIPPKSTYTNEVLPTVDCREHVALPDTPIIEGRPSLLGLTPNHNPTAPPTLH